MTETGICTNVLLAELHVQAGASCNDALLIYVIGLYTCGCAELDKSLRNLVWKN